MPQEPKPPQMFVWFKDQDGADVPRYLVPAQSQAEAIVMMANEGPGIVVPAEECDPGDIVRLVLPSLVMQLVQVTQLLTVLAKDAQERGVERAKNQLGLVRGN